MLVVIVLRLLGHGEGTRHRDLHAPRGVAQQELQVLDLHGMLAADLADDARHRIRMSGAIERGAGIIEIDALESGSEAVGVALAADFAVGDDVEPGLLLGSDRQERGVILRLGEVGLRHAPQGLHADARWKARGECRAIDEPIGLRVASYECGREEHDDPCRVTVA